MHYIVGTEIFINPVQTMGHQGSGPVPINAQKITRAAKKTTPFELGIRYVLHNIRPIKEGLEYRFVSEDGQAMDLVFDSVASAEQLISQAKGESAPDYSEFWRHQQG